MSPLSILITVGLALALGLAIGAFCGYERGYEDSEAQSRLDRGSGGDVERRR